MHGQAGGNGCVRVFTDAAQAQSPLGIPEKKPQGRDGEVRAVDQGVLVEKHRPDTGDLGKQREGYRRKAGDFLPHKRRAEIIGQSGAKDGQRQPGDHLVSLENDADDPVKRRQKRPGQTADQESKRGITGEQGGNKPRQGPHHHHTFNAEV